MVDREPRREEAPERVARQPDLVEPELVEEVEVVQDVVLDVVDRRVVGGGAETRVDRHDQPAALGERQQRVEAGRGAAAVEKDERRPLPGA